MSDHSVSGTKDRRPALDRLVTDAKRRKFDVLVTWKLDRLGRNLKHLITLLERIQALRRKPKGQPRASLAAIAAALNAEGRLTRTGKPWVPGTLHGILARG